MMYDLTGKAAFVTGAGGFIGTEVALELAAQGAVVSVADINTETAQRTVDKITAAGGKAFAYALDVTDSAAVDRVLADAAAKMGRLDIMIHVAGGSERLGGPNTYVPFTRQRDDVIDVVLAVNLFGAYYVSRAAARIMIEQGEGGRIINFSSIVGMNGLASSVAYAAAKGGVIAMTKSLAKELGEYKITVNSVAPGVVCRYDDVETDVGHHRYAYGTNFLNTMCTPKDIAAVTTFLSTDEARFITGQTYICDGGRSLGMKGSD